MRPHDAAFTLIELIVTLAVASIIALVAVPTFSQLISDNRLVTDVNRLNGHLQLARSEAVKRNRQTVICKSSDGHDCTTDGHWEQGWIIFTDPDQNERCGDTDGDRVCDEDGGKLVRHITPGASEGVTVRATGNPSNLVAYSPSGFADGYMGTFTFCDHRGPERARGLVLTMSGRLRVVPSGSMNLSCP